MMSKIGATLFEVFDSIQGEGPYLGIRQIFIRFSGCNLNCAYCDTKYAELARQFRLEQTPGKADFKYLNNPVFADELLQIVTTKWGRGSAHHSVALTGGEPLLQVDFLKDFLPRLNEKKILVYLETNGLFADRLGEIINLVDIVAFDIKLPSVTQQSPQFAEHKKALNCANLKSVFVKVVFSKETPPPEIELAAKIVAEVNPQIVLVLQPVTPAGKIKHPPSLEQMMSYAAIARRHLAEVRVIPQVHKLMKIS